MGSPTNTLFLTPHHKTELPNGIITCLSILLASCNPMRHPYKELSSLPHKALPDHTTRYQWWFGLQPNISYFRPFGAYCTARKLIDVTKFDSRGESGHMVGYAGNAKGYLFWHPGSGKLKVRRDLTFHGPPLKTIGQGGVNYAPYQGLRKDTEHIWDTVDVQQDLDDIPPHLIFIRTLTTLLRRSKVWTTNSGFYMRIYVSILISGSSNELLNRPGT